MEPETDPDVVRQYLEDAAHYPGGRATGVVRPRTVNEVSGAVRNAAAVLPVGARSSLTGGATPAGDLVISTERLTGIRVTGDRVVAGAGVALHDTAGGAWSAWPVAAAGSDLPRCDRRRCDFHQRRRRGDLQVRPDPPLGRRPDGRARDRRRARADARRRDGVGSRRVRGGDERWRSGDRAAADSHAGCAQAIGWVSRRPGHGPHRSVHRRRRDAGRGRRSGAARATPAGGRLLADGAARERGRGDRARRERCATRRTRRGGRAIRTDSTSPRSSTSIAGRSTSYARTASIGGSASRSRRRPTSCCWRSSSCPRPRSRATSGTTSPPPATRPTTRR